MVRSLSDFTKFLRDYGNGLVDTVFKFHRIGTTGNHLTPLLKIASPKGPVVPSPAMSSRFATVSPSPDIFNLPLSSILWQRLRLW